MAVFRVVKNSNYTVMSNIHLRDQSLSLKAKGLLSMLLSLPDNWNYSVRGLAAISKESNSSIGTALKELEAAGYLTRQQLRDERGQMKKIEYTIYEMPKNRSPCGDLPCTENPVTAKQDTGKPCAESPAQINKEKINKERSNTELNKNPFHSYQQSDETIAEEMGREREKNREIIRKNISYDVLISDGLNQSDIDEIIEIMLDVICTGRPFVVVEGEERPTALVKSRLLCLSSEHIRYVLTCMKENTTRVRNIKQYLLAVLYNAPATISHYYGARVNHDLNRRR